MKKTTRYLILAGLIFLSGVSVADTATLAVTGMLSTSACTPTLTVPDIALGNTEYASLPTNGSPLTLPLQVTSLIITCPAAVQVAWNITDNREGTAGPGGSDDFGLGLAESQRLGWYDIIQGDVTVDGNQGYMLARQAGSVSGWIQAAQSPQIDKKTEYTAAIDAQQFTPVAGRVVEYQLTVRTQLQSKQYLTLTANARLDGSATLSLIYL